MKKVFVNGEYRELADDATVETVVRELGVDRRGTAVAVNGEVIPRGEWHETALHDGQELEVLHAVQGGSPEAFEIAGRSLTSRLILGTGGFRSLEVMAASAPRVGRRAGDRRDAAGGPERARVDPRGARRCRARGAAQHGRVLHGARGRDDRAAGARGARVPTGSSSR